MQVPNYVLYAGILTPVCVYLGTLFHILHQVSLLYNLLTLPSAPHPTPPYSLLTSSPPAQVFLAPAAGGGAGDPVAWSSAVSVDRRKQLVMQRAEPLLAYK